MNQNHFAIPTSISYPSMENQWNSLLKKKYASHLLQQPVTVLHNLCIFTFPFLLSLYVQHGSLHSISLFYLIFVESRRELKIFKLGYYDFMVKDMFWLCFSIFNHVDRHVYKKKFRFCFSKELMGGNTFIFIFKMGGKTWLPWMELINRHINVKGFDINT